MIYISLCPIHYFLEHYIAKTPLRLFESPKLVVFHTFCARSLVPFAAKTWVTAKAKSSWKEIVSLVNVVRCLKLKQNNHLPPLSALVQASCQSGRCQAAEDESQYLGRWYFIDSFNIFLFIKLSQYLGQGWKIFQVLVRLSWIELVSDGDYAFQFLSNWHFLYVITYFNPFFWHHGFCFGFSQSDLHKNNIYWLLCHFQ